MLKKRIKKLRNMKYKIDNVHVCIIAHYIDGTDNKAKLYFENKSIYRDKRKTNKEHFTKDIRNALINSKKAEIETILFIHLKKIIYNLENYEKENIYEHLLEITKKDIKKAFSITTEIKETLQKETLNKKERRLKPRRAWLCLEMNSNYLIEIQIEFIEESQDPKTNQKYLKYTARLGIYKRKAVVKYF